MKARLPQGYGKGPGNLAGMMKQAQKMQEEMTTLQAELEQTEYEATVGGGAVTAVVTGKKELKSLSIKPEVVDPEDIEMLEDLIISAVNESVRKAEADSETRMNQITGGMNMGGLGGLL
ncbi:YbaB/EbfC family nucleoid-associated protein [Phocea massiliensis]|uniref:Nucleoid-associated protein H6A12_12095 n=1 Tax=Merdimmobilis hominis TaxID=2897707 RepID=A0A938X9C1_9FIRM|nr:YbaB/EbfC family nucleoid-associated protein [Merdimmobilis hominis]MBM6921884.1 YbaB/EbfC family nucleoid-associated protein [Merdimmobilis hominis]